MYPSQPVTPEGPRHAAPLPGGFPGQPPRMMSMNQSGPHGSATKHNALASFVTYVKAMESLDPKRFPAEYAENADRIKELKPFLKAHGILDVMAIKNPEVAALLGV
ncbi:hypothetical protein IU500_35560 [Nocardia terpenica]|uniref:Uncharacterized protein n=2 Tax=Nocardia terpenica TaxID=455432 RepID=A0A164MTW6_9NOCA|nr:hypothetical protein [Nocardia terpenica]ATL67023.1 hypothetical protein CRH09_13220 [Nocardia terpenica]KZM73656.1 hypothetical protein AWN90_34290 [Nocardia terpenica]MBF6066246.1 hypothetical protein [Nocardia terpenica]MBF6109334.1 hypothetical protein [Nocardia terpenica]MBF6116544.1 hypothetical protein [Nocardia terpenica]